MIQQTSQGLHPFTVMSNTTNAHSYRCELVASLSVNSLVCSFETFRKTTGSLLCLCLYNDVISVFIIRIKGFLFGFV